MENFLSHFLWFAVVISVVVFIHESGHFLVARLFGVRVEKFSIGFGPALLKYRDKKGTTWILSALPLGGYVKMYGDGDVASNPDLQKIEEMSPEDKDSAFFTKKSWQKSLIVAAGPFANYILAVFCFLIAFYNIGVPTSTSEVAFVQKESIADQAGIMPGDVMIKINNISVKDALHFKEEIIQSDSEVNLTILREEEEYNLSLDFGSGDKILGVRFSSALIKSDVFNTFIAAVEYSYLMTEVMIHGLVDILTGKLGIDNIGGPLQIAEYSSKAAEQSFNSFILFIALISLNLFIVNLLPIPMLDGGHLLIYGIESIIGRSISPGVRIFISRVGFIILIFIIILSVTNDIQKLFN